MSGKPHNDKTPDAAVGETRIIVTEGDAPKQSDFARALEQIKTDTLAAAGKRSHLPQPLFWSLFHSRLAELKAEKSAVRELEELFGSKLS